MEALQRLKLGGYAGGKGADGNVANVAEEVLNTNLFCFFSLDNGGSVYECLCGCGSVLAVLASVSRCSIPTWSSSYISDFLNGKVGVCWHTHILWLNINNDK